MPAETINKQKLDWADDVDDDAVDQQGPITRQEDDGTRVTVEYRVNEDGKKVKITRRTRMRLVQAQVNHAVAERKKWKKFGEASGLAPGPDSNSTSFGEQVFLKLTTTLKEQDNAPSEEKNPLEKLLQSAGKNKINCRICKGDHYTYKCPYKDTHQPLDEIAAPEPAAAPEPSATHDASGKYIPPSLRNKGLGGAPPVGETMGGRGGDRRDDLSTIRITNLSEDTTEQDVKDLVSRFGHTSRVFVARDRETNTCKGFAFVSYYSKEDAEKAQNALNGYGYDNLILRVEWAKSNKD
ncbi:translation initiation factor eIF3 subunit g [Rhizophlyctis rosea]|uniref:Eukaryotic translation initiation factor 3 subunit G n=1 Tax=Rhizophlyctis rosea TaxID=64517 RepID=A0AAD5SDN6_9FUNG|nr:translation initiation factor eIF3 subunit g [Rhizophlyctis rosea]